MSEKVDLKCIAARLDGTRFGPALLLESERSAQRHRPHLANCRIMLFDISCVCECICVCLYVSTSFLFWK